MLRVYNTLLLPVRGLAWLRAGWDSRHPERRREWRERRARVLPQVAPGGVWLHGASVGEARIVTALARALREQVGPLPLSVSAFTRTGRAQLPRPPEVDAAFFLPLDFPGMPARLLRVIAPRPLALIETELWPNLIHEAARAGTSVIVLNGRLAPERMQRYQRFAGLYGPTLGGLERVGAQSEQDAHRFATLGVPESRIEVTGNLKFDLPSPTVDGDVLRERLRIAPGRPIFIAGSTAEGEDAGVVEAFETVRRDFSGLLLVLAPRHPERVPEVERLLQTRGLAVDRLSKLERDPSSPPRDVLLVDTVGQLSALYALASVAFVGGSLVPVGGHNLLEPASLGVPVLFGPHTHHVRELAELLEGEGAGRRVGDASELGRELRALLGKVADRRLMGEAGRRVLERNRGALARSVNLLLATRAAAGGRGDVS